MMTNCGSPNRSILLDGNVSRSRIEEQRREDSDVASRSPQVPAETRKRPHRILHVVRQYFPSVGGMEQHVHDLTQLQSQRGPIFILTFNRIFGRKGKLPSIERCGRVVVIRAPFIGFRSLFLPLFARSLINRFDLIHVHGLDQCADLISFFAKRGGTPFVLTTHGLFFHTERLKRAKRFYFDKISRRTLSNAHHIFAVSEVDSERLKAIEIESLHIRNPITPFEWQYKGRSDLIYVGRYAANKNIQDLIPFVAELRRLGWTHRLHIVGGGDEAIHAQLKTLIANHGLKDAVCIQGHLSCAHLSTLFGECGYAISASRYEGYGMAIVEAMSAGLLPVMQPNPAFQELHSQCPCGVLIDFEKPIEAARQFLIWEKTADIERRNSARAHALAQSWTTVTDVIDDYYLQSMAGQKSTRTRRQPCL
jgi:alpha-1,3-mannosyltransferase